MSGSRVTGICDRCGLEYRLKQLRKQVVAKNTTNLLVCRDCLDKDQPQWFGPRISRPDPRPIPNARPELNEPEINAGFGWGPVGGIGVYLMVGVPYDFDMPDDLVVSGPPNFLLQESGFLLIQEDGGPIELEN